MLGVYYGTGGRRQSKEFAQMVKSWTLSYYFIAFVDVLGQSNKLLNLTRLPSTKDERDKATVILIDAVDNVLSLRKGFKQFFRNRNKSPGILDSLPPDKRAIAEKLRRAEAIVTGMSDAIVIAIPLNNEDDHSLSISSIYSALYSICAMFLAALVERNPIRCGIDVGVGVPLNKREVYGPSVVRAYNLESRIASYPRIVVGDSLFNYLNFVQSLGSESIYAKFAKKMAGNCKELLTLDYDKVRILDVIGEGVQSIVGGIDKSLVEKAYKFVVQSHNRYSETGYVKLRARYGSLRSYFESKIHLWDIQPINS
jgi:hypothetical protein